MRDRWWLTQFTMQTVAQLLALDAAVVARMLMTLGLASLTVDVDGTVVSMRLQVEHAFRGFNPYHRKVRSYYPILAHLAETTHVLRVKNRSGNVHDGKAALPFAAGRRSRDPNALHANGRGPRESRVSCRRIEANS